MNIYFGDEGFKQLELLKEKYNSIFVLTDENINTIYSSIIDAVSSYKIVIPAG